MSETKTEIATRPATIMSLISSDQYKKQFAAALPRHLSADRFVRVAMTALTRQPALKDCDQGSFMLALLSLSALGLEPDGRRAHLIPFKNNQKGITEVQLIVDYKGLAELVRRSGEVSDLHADVVYEGDEFSYCYGTGSHLKHKPALKGRGEIIASYSYVRLKDGSDSFDVLPLDDVTKVRDSSQGYKSAIKYGKTHPWTEHFGEMAKKTAFRRHSKWLPLSPELREKLEKDDEDLQMPEINVTPKAPIVESFTPAPEPEPAPVVKETLTPEPLVLDPEPPKGAELLRIKCGEYGTTQADIIKLLQYKKACGRTSKTFEDLTDDKLQWLDENFEGVMSGKAFQ
jgi:recombination protein RecT